MKTLFLILINFFLIQYQLISANDPDITIYYGLNDSHSNNWAQLDADGNIGITYFQRSSADGFEGILKYKTIHTNGSVNIEDVTSGTHLEKSVLLFDNQSKPNIFLAQSTNNNQWIDHYFKNVNGQWQSERIINFNNEGSLFIYELSADKGPDGSFHLLILKTRSNIDSDDFMEAWRDSYLYHLTNVTGNWQNELIRNYNMAYTYDMYVKSSKRQDIKVDDEGYVHVIFSEQIDGEDDPSRLLYANNKSGSWEIETAITNDYGIRDDAGWFPSLCLDNESTPYVSCMYINRVMTYSAVYCKLYLLKRIGKDNWQKNIIAAGDDGYYGGDGRNYTGGLSHLVFDSNNIPHIIFSDIASTHWPVLNQRLNVGNIRYGVLVGGNWNITTIYRQSLPDGFYNAVEMHGMCLILSSDTDTKRIIGQELITESEHQYTCNLVYFTWDGLSSIDDEDIYNFILSQNYPNPFNPATQISYSIPSSNIVTLKIYDSLGREIYILVNEQKSAGSHSIVFDAGELPSGIYFYELKAGNYSETKKMVLLR
ncbi:T9SS type A sorting domain-containing protein [Bacteroidota bacterium]